MTDVLYELTVEARLGLADALRQYAIPAPTATEYTDSVGWRLRSPTSHRRDVTAADRIIVALLSGDTMTAAAEIESAGPVTTGLICLRIVVSARRRARPCGDAGAVDAHAGRLRDSLSQTILVPASDRAVWDEATAAARELQDTLSADDQQCPPLQRLAEAMAPRSLLARRGFAAAFAARHAAHLAADAASLGRTQIDSARELAALVIAYTDGTDVTHSGGRIRLPRHGPDT